MTADPLTATQNSNIDKQVQYHDQAIMTSDNTIDLVVKIALKEGGWKAIPLSIDSSKDTIEDIQEKVEQKCPQLIDPAKRYGFLLDATPLLDPTRPLKKYGVTGHNTTLRMLDTILDATVNGPLYVEIPSINKTIELSMNPMWDTIYSAKKMIAKQENIPVRLQTLYFKEKQQPDHKSFVELKIPKKSTLKLEELDPTMDIKIITSVTNHEKAFTVKERDTVEDLKRLLKIKIGTAVRLALRVDKGHNKKEFEELQDNKSLSIDYHLHRGSTVYLLEDFKVSIKRDGNKTKFHINSCDSVTDLKTKINEKLGISIDDDHQLFFDGALLKDDGVKIQSCGILPNSALELEPIRMCIHVQHNQNTKNLDISLTSSVLDVKTRLLDLTGIPIDDQILMWQGKLLETEESLLQDLGIKNGSSLQLDTMQVFIKGWEGKTLELPVALSDTIDDLLSNLQSKILMPATQPITLTFDGTVLQLRSNTLGGYGIGHKSILVMEPLKIKINILGVKGNVFQLEVGPDELIMNIKQQIEQRDGIPPAQQGLLLEGSRLRNGRTVKDSKIQNDSTIALELINQSIHINIEHPQNNAFRLEVGPGDTISHVKGTIEAQKGIPRDRQILSFQGLTLSEGKTIEDYSIEDGSTVDLESMKINIKGSTGNAFRLEVSPTEKIDGLKRKIQEQTSIPRGHQILTYQGSKLRGGKSIKDYNIEHDSTLEFSQAKVEPKVDTADTHILIVNQRFGTLKLLVSLDEQIGWIKAKIEKETGVFVNTQVLFFNKLLLSDNHSLSHYKIRQNSTLTLDRMKVIAATPRGNLPLEVVPATKIGDVKIMVEDAVGISAETQFIKCTGKFLDDQATILDSCISHNDIIYVQLENELSKADESDSDDKFEKKVSALRDLEKMISEDLAEAYGVLSSLEEERADIESLEGRGINDEDAPMMKEMGDKNTRETADTKTLVSELERERKRYQKQINQLLKDKDKSKKKSTRSRSAEGLSQSFGSSHKKQGKEQGRKKSSRSRSSEGLKSISHHKDKKKGSNHRSRSRSADKLKSGSRSHSADGFISKGKSKSSKSRRNDCLSGHSEHLNFFEHLDPAENAIRRVLSKEKLRLHY